MCRNLIVSVRWNSAGTSGCAWQSAMAIGWWQIIDNYTTACFSETEFRRRAAKIYVQAGWSWQRQKNPAFLKRTPTKRDTFRSPVEEFIIWNRFLEIHHCQCGLRDGLRDGVLVGWMKDLSAKRTRTAIARLPYRWMRQTWLNLSMGAEVGMWKGNMKKQEQ